MPGKYSKYRNQLQRRSEDTLGFKDQLTILKSKLSSKSRTELAAELAKLKNKKARYKFKQKAGNLDIVAREKLLAEHLESSGEESFKLSTGGTFFLKDSLYVSVKDREAYRQWCIANGYELQLMLPHKVTESIIGECLTEGKPYPPGVEVFIDVKVDTRGVINKEYVQNPDMESDEDEEEDDE